METAIEQWVECIAITDRHRGRPGHCVVGYGRLVRDPERTLAELCAALGLPYTADMIVGRATAARGLIKDFEHWKAGNAGPLFDRPGRRLEETFDPETRR